MESKNTKRMANILLINVPYAGHTNPTLPLAKRLVQSGHTVSYINALEFKSKIEATGATFIPYANYPANPTAQKKKTACFQAAFDTAMQLEETFDILIYEMFFYLGNVIAERKNIPCVRQFSQPAWNNERLSESTFLWEFSCKLIDMQIVGKKKALQMGVVGKTLINSVLNDQPDLNVVYVPKLFQPKSESFDESFIFTCPPMNTATATDLKIPYAKMKHPIVYASLGSIMSNKGFCLNCIKAFGGKDISLILSTGKVNPEQLLNIPSNIYVYSFVPQLEVLQNADLFITHGGMNSVNEAMYFGVPMLVMPVINDQLFNAKRVMELQIGRRMRSLFTNATLLYKNAMAVINNSNYKNNATIIRENICNEMQLDEVVEKIEHCIR